jgi:hypothetical protein
MDDPDLVDRAFVVTVLSGGLPGRTPLHLALPLSTSAAHDKPVEIEPEKAGRPQRSTFRTRRTAPRVVAAHELSQEEMTAAYSFLYAV